MTKRAPRGKPRTYWAVLNKLGTFLPAFYESREVARYFCVTPHDRVVRVRLVVVKGRK